MGKVCKISVFLICAIAMFVSSIAYAGNTERVIVLNNGEQANSYSANPSMSADGRYVAFESTADNLVSDDTNGWQDVFVRDMQTGEIQRVSLASDGVQFDSTSYNASISADGRFVAFASWKDGVVGGVTNGCFVRDMQTGKTECVSVSSDGVKVDGYSDLPSISADGRFVAFTSYADNLVPSDTNEQQDIFVHDRQTGETKRVSINNDGEESNGQSDLPSISADGKFVAFSSCADNLVPNDTNMSQDIFIHNMQTGDIEGISKSTDGVLANSCSSSPSISADGRFVAFESGADNLVSGSEYINGGLFVRDTQAGITECVDIAKDGSQANCCSYTPRISADGRFVTFASYADNLVTGDDNETIDVFVRDRQTGETRLESVTSEGLQADFGSWNACISSDGRFITFESLASNLVPGDLDEYGNIYIHDMEGVSLNKTEMLLTKGSTETLVADVHLFGTTNNDVVWSSSNNDVATVDANGKITAISDGNCVVTVTTVDKSLTANCSIIVKSMIYFTSPTIKDYCDSYSKKISISGKIDSSLTKASWQIDSKHKGSCKIKNGFWSASKIELALGENLVTITGITKNKQTYTSKLLVNYIDNIEPEIKITSHDSKPVFSTTKKTINISGLATDAETITKVTWMNFTTFESGECTGTKSWKALKINLAAKSNDIYISAEDSSGNVGTSQITVIRVDKIKPKVVITTPTNKPSLKHNEQNITLRGTASDNIDIEKVAWLNKSTGESGACTGYTEWKSSIIPLQIGKNSIIVTATDESNNKATDTITVTRK